MPSVPTIESWPLAARIAGAIGTSSNIWHLVMHRRESAAEVLELDLASLYDGQIRRVKLANTEEWVRAAKKDAEDVLIVATDSSWAADNWASADLQRTKLMRKGSTIIVINKQSAQGLASFAPNIWSWIAGTVWDLNCESENDD